MTVNTSPRIQRLMEKVHPREYAICVEKARYITESFKQTEGQPQIIRVAKGLENILNKVPIFIEDDELIVGNAASKPMGLEFEFSSGIWTKEEIDSLRRDNYIVTVEDEKDLLEMNKYWKDQISISRTSFFLNDEEMWLFRKAGVTLPPWKSKNEGPGGGYAQGGMGITALWILCVDYERVLNQGLNSIIQEAEKELTNIDYGKPGSLKKAYFLQSVIIAHKAIISFADRFSVLAAEMAAKESNPQRKQELQKISEACKWVPANPPRSFFEAMQSFWFMFLQVTPSTTAAAGRFDQYMYPFYKKDIDDGVTNDEEVLELLQCLRIKNMQINRTSGTTLRQKNAGMAKWHNWTIGGQTPDGRDATNNLTYLLLESARRCQTPHFTMTLRVHDGTPEQLMIKALEVVKTGLGMPAFTGDRSFIEYLLSGGVPIADARNYVLTGCIDVNIPGKSRIGPYAMFIVSLVFDFFLHNGINPRTGDRMGPDVGKVETFNTFDELLKAFETYLKYFMGLLAKANNFMLQVTPELTPDPVRSSLMIDGVSAGKDYFERIMPFENAAVMNPVGMINVADSLAAIKKVVFDDKHVTMKKLVEVLDANWEGYESLRKECVAVPKYGNDEDYVDNILKELYRFWAATAVTFDTVTGGKHIPTGVSISAQWPGGALTGATPDGRFAGEVLADGTLSPAQGRDIHGPTAVIKSAIKVDQVPFQATLLNMKFHPSALKSQSDMSKLSALIRTYFNNGGKHVQFNVVGKETLLEAQKSPEAHRDLIVRVAGYSAYFIQLGSAIQGDVINRMEFDKLAN